MPEPCIDLFAGAGGFDLAARELGLDPLGIEWSDSACAIREAAGLRTLQADVAALDPLDFAPLGGLIGGPPCPAFSSAGKGEGRDAMPAYVDFIERMGEGESIDRAEMDAACGDERAHLVLEPLRWTLALMPRWIVLEQVPPVLPLWEAMAVVLRSRGYSVAVGILSAETFGVPQTRRRAFLLASLDGPVSMPRPTHQRYVAPRRREEATDALFAAPEPERIVLAEDAGLLPWVSMAQALNMAEGPSPSPSPSPSVTGGGGATGGVEVFASKAARARALSAVGYQTPYGEGMIERHGDRTPRSALEPAPAITGKSRSAEWVLRSGQSVAGEGRAERPVDEPSLSVVGRFDLCSWVGDRPAPDEGIIVGRQLPDGEGRNVGGHGWDGEPAGNEPERATAVRVTLEEAACLQSFPPGFPWMAAGSKTAAFLAIGNAVPKLLAEAVLGVVVDLAVCVRNSHTRPTQTL